MARPIRIEYEGAFYHVTARGNERRKIFFSGNDYAKFKDYLGEAKRKFRVVIHAYVLMSNHYHLLLETPEKNLSRVMHHINGSYTTYTNIKRKRSGHLFQGRYKAIVVEKDSYLLELSRYLHLNPVRAKVVTRPEEYPHSSYRHYITGQGDGLLNSESVLGMISNQPERGRALYRAFVESALGKEMPNPNEMVYGGTILGRESFVRKMLGRLDREQLAASDVSMRRELRAKFTVDEILQSVLAHYQTTMDEAVRNRRCEARRVGIYLLKTYTGATNRAIGELFGGLSYSAVAKVRKNVEGELEMDRGLAAVVEGLVRGNSLFKG